MTQRILFLAVLAVIVSVSQHGNHAANNEQTPVVSKVDAGEDIPTFHSAPPQGELPATLSESDFPGGDLIVKIAYTLAARIKPVLYQMPCYCFCERNEKHQSLLDCYRGKHAAECNVCKREALYAYRETAKGRSAEEIRAGIIRGEWKDIDYTQWQQLPPPLKDPPKTANE